MNWNIEEIKELTIEYVEEIIRGYGISAFFSLFEQDWEYIFVQAASQKLDEFFEYDNEKTKTSDLRKVLQCFPTPEKMFQKSCEWQKAWEDLIIEKASKYENNLIEEFYKILPTILDKKYSIHDVFCLIYEQEKFYKPMMDDLDQYGDICFNIGPFYFEFCDGSKKLKDKVKEKLFSKFEQFVSDKLDKNVSGITR